MLLKVILQVIMEQEKFSLGLVQTRGQSAENGPPDRFQRTCPLGDFCLMVVHTIRQKSAQTDSAVTCATLEGQCFHACVESLRRMRDMAAQRTDRTRQTDRLPADMFLSKTVGWTNVRWKPVRRTCLVVCTDSPDTSVRPTTIPRMRRTDSTHVWKL